MEPYRVLGLEPGASQAEVKRAYRRLAKTLHPDSAGEQSLPAFLAVQEAYEQLVGSNRRGGIGSGRASRSGPAGSRSRNAGPAAGPASDGAGWQEPWRADPERARAAREQARARWGARAAGGATSAGSGSTARGSSGGAAGGPSTRAPGDAPSGGAGSGRRGSAGSTAGPRTRSGSRDWATGSGSSGEDERYGSARSGSSEAAGRSRRRASRKATLGSTSYDEARDASDPRWAGASWYGPTTGEYWIVNPREYADPRKHGPGYSSRGRTGGSAWRRSVDPDDGIRPESTGEEPGGSQAAGNATMKEPAPGAASSNGSNPASATSSEGMGRSRTSPGEPEATKRGQSIAETPFPVEGSPGTASSTAPGLWWHALGEPGPTDATRRVGVALLAWAPIGLAVAGLVNELTGCASYALSCDGTDQLLPWLAQGAILGLLLLIPLLARVFATGTIGLLIGLVPGMAVLIAFGGAHATAAGSLLGLIAAIAWLIGVGWAVRALLRPR